MRYKLSKMKNLIFLNAKFLEHTSKCNEMHSRLRVYIFFLIASYRFGKVILSHISKIGTIILFQIFKIIKN